MVNRAEKDLLELKNSLEKAVGGEDASEQQALDVLKALRAIPISVDLLRKTNIGQTLQGFKVVLIRLISVSAEIHAYSEIKKTCSFRSAVEETKSLLSKWKKDCEPKTPKASSELEKKIETQKDDNITSTSAKSVSPRTNESASPRQGDSELPRKSIPLTKVSASKAVDPTDDGDELDDETLFRQLTPMRRKVNSPLLF